MNRTKTAVVASCSAFPGCHSQGRTKEEATANIIEAIQGYIASMRKHGEPVPVTDYYENRLKTSSKVIPIVTPAPS